MAGDKIKEIDVVVSDPQPGIEGKGEESSGTWTKSASGALEV
jgi:hypothetical protein